MYRVMIRDNMSPRAREILEETGQIEVVVDNEKATGAPDALSEIIGGFDGLAIRSGTWTISPANTVGLDLAGILPLEEITFFLATNVVIVFGMVLMLARESHIRARTPLGRALREKEA